MILCRRATKNTKKVSPAGIAGCGAYFGDSTRTLIVSLQYIHSLEERRRQAYVDDPEVVAPSVITLNAECCSQAANDFLMRFLGLTHDNARGGYLMKFCRERLWMSVDRRAEATCPHCGG